MHVATTRAPTKTRVSSFDAWTLLVLASLIDWHFTLKGLELGGTELNPLAAAAFRHGPMHALILKIASLALALLIVPISGTRSLLLGGACMYALIDLASLLQLLSP